MNQISLTTGLALTGFQASYYSHHRSQSALGETNWLLKVSGCNLTLNPYLVIQMGHNHGHPLTGAMGLRPDHWSVAPEVSPRDPQGITRWHGQTFIKQQYENIKVMFTIPYPTVRSIPRTHHILNPYIWSSPPHESRVSSHVNTMFL